MIIEEILPEDLYEGRMEISISTNTGIKGVNFGRGEPEDNSLSRDLNDALLIKSMLVMAYEAGKAGEELTIDSKKEDE